jgi:hypothetical protein
MIDKFIWSKIEHNWCTRQSIMGVQDRVYYVAKVEYNWSARYSILIMCAQDRV